MPKTQPPSRSAPYAPRKKPVRVVSMADLVEDLKIRGQNRKPWVQRFWENVKREGPNDCWLWSGKPFRGGYSMMSISNAQYRVHRLSFLIKNGTIEPDLFVIHSCDNKMCVNPAHLSQDTIQENNRQSKERNRMRRGERHGMAKLAESEVTKIRRLYAGGGLTQREIAEMFGVHNPQICRIVNFKSRRRP